MRLVAALGSAMRVHVHAGEHAAAMHPAWRERARYRPAHFAHGPDWVVHKEEGERWFGFDAIRALPGCDDDVLLVPHHGSGTSSTPDFVAAVAPRSTLADEAQARVARVRRSS